LVSSIFYLLRNLRGLRVLLDLSGSRKPNKVFDEALRILFDPQRGPGGSGSDPRESVHGKHVRWLPKFRYVWFELKLVRSPPRRIILKIFCYLFDIVTGTLASAVAAEGVSDIMNVTLVPFGNAQLNNATKTVTCQ
jgi:hypothetical protein